MIRHASLLLVDWDTVGLALPERDLWLVSQDPYDTVLQRYTALSGHVIDPLALRLYALRWRLDDIAIYLTDLRMPHRATPHTAHAWQSLNSALSLDADLP